MVRQIAPLFFTIDIPATLAYYKDKLGFECLGAWQDPPVYAIVARDQQAIHFRCAESPTANPDKYRDELLDAYLLAWFLARPRTNAWSEICVNSQGGLISESIGKRRNLDPNSVSESALTIQWAHLSGDPDKSGHLVVL